MVVVTPEDHAEQAMRDAQEASHEHPARVLGIILGKASGPPRVDARIGIGAGWSGEMALIKLSGAVVHHDESVVLPLLLPDSPVVVWWPVDPPNDPAADRLGALAQRRITDAAAVTRGHRSALLHQCSAYTSGNTDLAWTRLTPWRALLAAALDQFPEKVIAASVTGERVSPSADLMAAWLSDRLKVDVERHASQGPGLTEVVLTTSAGDVRLSRHDGVHAVISSPGAPDRPIALPRREVPALLTEELRRLDEDEVYARTVAHLLELEEQK